MNNSPRIAIVTGGNKGIGFAITTALCKNFDGIVYLTARNPALGNEAVEKLKKQGFNPKYHQLDIDNVDSIKALAKYIITTYGGFDVLVNNAGMAYKVSDPAPVSEQAEVTIRVNYFGTLKVCEELFPLLRPHGRVVNVSSSEGMLEKVTGANIREKLTSPTLTKNELSKMMQDYVNDVKAGKHLENGWQNSTYSVSKVAVAALTILQQRAFDKDARPDLIVNAVHPGFVDTDMTSHQPNLLSPEEGAAAPAYLALLPENVNSPKGNMVWTDKKIVKWGPY